MKAALGRNDPHLPAPCGREQECSCCARKALVFPGAEGTDNEEARELRMMDSILRALNMASAMGWEILWPLILGFALSAVVQAVVSHRQMSRLLPNDRPASIATALALGAASSSCSYAAVALARSLFRKGADFTAAMAFEMASTNLVLELSIIMLVFLGWQITLAEFIGAPIMVALLVVLFRIFLTRDLRDQAKKQAVMPRWICPSAMVARSGSEG